MNNRKDYQSDTHPLVVSLYNSNPCMPQSELTYAMKMLQARKGLTLHDCVISSSGLTTIGTPDNPRLHTPIASSAQTAVSHSCFHPSFPVLVLFPPPFLHVFSRPLSLACKDFHQTRVWLVPNKQIVFSSLPLICTARWAAALFICLSLFLRWAAGTRAFPNIMHFSMWLCAGRRNLRGVVGWILIHRGVSEGSQALQRLCLIQTQLINAIHPFVLDHT